MTSDRTANPQGQRRPLIVAAKAASILAALVVTFALGFLLLGIAGFMLPTTGSDPDERLEHGFWFAQGANIPVLLSAIWLTAIGVVFNRGKVYWCITGGVWLLSASLASLGFAILHDVAGIGSAVVGKQPIAIHQSPSSIFHPSIVDGPTGAVRR